MKDRGIEQYISVLYQRTLADGGFASQPGASYRPDATAWAITALAGTNAQTNLIDAARTRLAADIRGDGRVSISPEHPESFWPTPLAILAWHGSSKHRGPLQVAARFLLSERGASPLTGKTAFPPPPSDGWPWIAGTHTWVEPTALALLALRIAGYGGHQRCREGEEMLMERQLPHGGWNIGSTVVYGQELRPQPDATGLALAALAGRVPHAEVKGSIEYLRGRLVELRTPLSLAWGLLGLGAWGEQPEAARRWVNESLALQKKYGSYDTTLLALLVLAYVDTGWAAGLDGAGGLG